MKDTHNHNFEDEFRKAFKEAQATPSPKLWAEIDAHLANKEASVYKRKLYYFKLGAAAAAVLTLSFIGLWLMNDQFTGNTIATLPQKTSPATEVAGVQSNATNQAAEEKGRQTSTPALAQHAGNEKTSTSQESLPARTVPPQPMPDEDNTVAAKTPAIVSPSETPSENTSTLERSATANETVTSANVGEYLASERNPTDSRQNSVAANTEAKSAKNNSTLVQPHTKEPVIASNTPSAVKSTLADVFSAAKPADKLVSGNESIHQKNLNSGQKTTLTDQFTSYNLNRLHSSVHMEDNAEALQAPVVKVKANTAIYIEEEKKARSTASRWSVGMAFTPGQFNPNMEVNQTAAATLTNAKSYFYNSAPANAVAVGATMQNSRTVGKDLENAESVDLSYNVGVQVNFALSGKFSLQSGIQYLHNNSQISTDNYLENMYNREKLPEFMAFISPESDPVSFTVVNSPEVHNKSVDQVAMVMADRYSDSYPGVTEVLVYNTYQYLSVPLRLHYKLTDNKISTSIGAGLAADIFMKNTIGNPKENIANQELTRSNNAIYKDVGMSGLLSAKVDYKISPKYSIYLEPSYRTALSSFTRSSMISSHPSSFGIGTGFLYRF